MTRALAHTLLITSALAALAGCPPPPEEPDRVADILLLTGDPEVGADVYSNRCRNCHAADGSGQSGPSLLESTITDEEFIVVVLEGAGLMPSAQDLSDQNIADVISFVDTL